MNIPGFTAERALVRPRATYRAIAFRSHGAPGRVIPTQTFEETGRSCFEDCMWLCRSTIGDYFSCMRSCQAFCDSHPI